MQAAPVMYPSVGCPYPRVYWQAPGLQDSPCSQSALNRPTNFLQETGQHAAIDRPTIKPCGYGFNNASPNAARELQIPGLGRGNPLFTNHSQQPKRLLPDDVTEVDGAKRRRGRSPKHLNNLRAQETSLEKLEGIADALNGRHNCRRFAKPPTSEEMRTQVPDKTMQTAAAGDATVNRTQNALQSVEDMWTANLDGLRRCLESETKKATQKVMDDGAEITATMEAGWTSAFEVCKKELEQLLAKAVHASRKLEIVAEECESARLALVLEQRRCLVDMSAVDSRFDLTSLASRLQHVEARLGIEMGLFETSARHTREARGTSVKPEQDDAVKQSPVP
ncbi:MAG: hypothetical protein Q9172_000296 [Xanthocarpia lactea]